MFISYENIGNICYKLTKNEKFKSFFYNWKIEQNIKYIAHNKPNVLKKLKKKLENGEKLHAVFYVYDETKWKCQSLYDLLSKDNRFNVTVLVSKTAPNDPKNPSYQSIMNVAETYKFFKTNGMNVKCAYDTVKQEFIPFKKFKPDIIFYQHPWYVKTEQGPVVCSKFALTCYIPYYFPIETHDVDCNLRFHKYIENHYILDDYTKQKYLNKNPELESSLKAVGYPYLDYFSDKDFTEGEYYIYAPHWTICGKGLAYGTFEWNGKYILEYAKSHPEIKWIFKPHPLLKKALVDCKLMAEKEVSEYYSEWNKIGIKYESGNYLGLFAKSKMMITDCSSFLGEYFLTEKPLIHLMSEKSQFRESNNPILKTYYRAEDLESLKSLLEQLPQKDEMKEVRKETLENIGLKNNCTSKNILNDIINEISSEL